MKRTILIMTLFTITLTADRIIITPHSSHSSKDSDFVLKLRNEKEVSGNGKPFCFERGTMISMADGSSKPIDKILPGDRILSVNFTEMIVEEDIVEKTDSALHNNFVKITFDDLTTIINTDDHPFYTKGEGRCSVNPESTFKKFKIHAGNLTPGDFCYRILSGKLINIRITNIQRIPAKQTGFSIMKLSRNRCFFANGKLVSTEEPDIKKVRTGINSKK